MKRLLIIIFAFSAIMMTAQRLHFRQLTVKDGLLNNSVISLGQDTKGDIWVATHSGLLRYDGQQFLPLPYNELPDKRVDRINRADDGTMWVQCFGHNKLVSRYDTQTHHFVTYNIDELSTSILQQAIKPLNRKFTDPYSSRVWSINKRQLKQSDSLRQDAQFVYTGTIAQQAGLKDEIFYSLLLDRQGMLWAGSANNGLFFADTRTSHYRRLVCQPNPLARTIFVDNNGTLWMTIGDQKLFTLPKNAVYSTLVNYPKTDSVEGRRVRTIVEDGKNRLWVGTRDGLYMRNASDADFCRVPIEGGKKIIIFSLCIDDKDCLWVGTDRGLYRLPLNKIEPKIELVDSSLINVVKMVANKNKLWMATEQELYCRVDGKTILWSNEAVHDIAIDAREQIWAGTDNGIAQITENGLQHFATDCDGHIMKSLLCWRDFLWCSHEQGLCCVNIYTGQSTILQTEHNEYLDRTACIDSRNATIYFGGTLGIDCFQADSLDEKLRSGVSQLWLEEVQQKINEQPKRSIPTIVYYLILTALIAVGGAITIYFIRKKPKYVSKNEENVEMPFESTPNSMFIQKARAITELHMGDTDFTAEIMAQEMAMSRSKLFMLMKKETGKTVMEFVREMRLENAAQQLSTGASITEITIACGFSDPSSFRRSFVKKFGITPSQYREKSK